ncbi:MAG: recombinase family protein [Phocaeicola sp.]
MAKVGYILKSDYSDTLEADKRWMDEYGCCRIVEELSEQEKQRPQWKQLLECLERGDELVITKFSNAIRGSRELALFLELCRVKVIRIIAIHDKIDSKGVLFPETTIVDVLNMFGSLPEEVAALRKASAHIEQLKTNFNLSLKATTKRRISQTKVDRENGIVNMYNSGYSIEDIWKVSGFSSRSSVFRVLNKYGVDLNRGKFKGSIKKRQR